MTGLTHNVEWFEGMLDRHGADFDAWPDREAAHAARRLVLADPHARSAFDTARRLDTLLAARADDLAADAGQNGLSQRIVAAVMPGLSTPAMQTRETRRWIAGFAASFVIAGFLGGAFDQILFQDRSVEELDVTTVEMLVYGPTEVDLP